MDLYKLHGNVYSRLAMMEDYESLIWTERWIEPGDFRVVAPATLDNAAFLRPKSLLVCDESRIPMLVETREIANGVITASGKSIDGFFDERGVSPAGYSGGPAEVTAEVFTNMQTRYGGGMRIAGVRLGLVDDGAYFGDPVSHVIEGYAKAGEEIRKAGKFHDVGFNVVWVWDEDEKKHELVFNTASVADHTSQGGNPLVRFAVSLDNIADIRELYSVVGEVNHVIVLPPAWTMVPGEVGDTQNLRPLTYPGAVYNSGLYIADMFHYKPFEVRLREFEASDLTPEYLADFVENGVANGFPSTLTFQDAFTTWANMTARDKATLIRFLMQRAAVRLWKENNQDRKLVIDGELVPNEILRYGSDYQLGALVEIEAMFTGGPGSLQPMVVTEFTRSVDGSGKRAWPTLVPRVDAMSDEGRIASGTSGDG